MGRHSKPEPKSVSFLGSASGIFVAMALAGGIFAVSHITGDNPITNRQDPPVERRIDTETPRALPGNLVVTGTATTSLPGPTTAPSLPTDGPRVIVPVVPPGTPTEPPTQNPSPNPSPRTPDVDVDVDVETPIVGVDTDVELQVPLLGQAVDTVGDVVEGVTDPVVGTVKDLLDK